MSRCATTSIGRALLFLAALLAGGCARESRASLLDEVLASRNDNDPRLDTAFDGLSLAEKASFRRRYEELPRERRNERGTIVYLLGRNLAVPEDWAFLRKVVAEPPCLSLSDCSKKGPEAPEPGDEVTLAYPALVALRQAALKLPEPQARLVLDDGARSPVPAVRRLASRLVKEVSGPEVKDRTR